MNQIALIMTGVLLNAAAQLVLKAGMRRIGYFEFAWANAASISLQVLSNPFVWAGFVLYGISVLVWLLVLSRVEVSFAYPMLSVGYIVNAVAAYFLFQEDVSPMRIAGIAVIVVGVYLVSRT